MNRRLRIDSRAITLAAVVLLAGISLSCFNQPVRQKIELVFHPDGTAEIAVTTRIDPSAFKGSNAELEDRLSRLSETTVNADDTWSRAIRSSHPVRERRTYEFAEGNLLYAVRESLLEDARDLEEIFGKSGIGAFVETEEERMSLELVPLAPSRASERQERKVMEGVEAFGKAVGDYLESTGNLYAYLAEHPDRVRALMGASLEIDEEIIGDGQELSREESALIDDLGKTSVPITEVLSSRGGEAYTLDELSQLVFSPFPGPLSLEIAGRIEEVDGFERLADGRLGIPEMGFWGALTFLQDRWITPLPVVDLINLSMLGEEQEKELSDKEFFEVLLSKPRVVRNVPSAYEVTESLKMQLSVRDYYRIVWTIPPREEAEPEN